MTPPTKSDRGYSWKLDLFAEVNKDAERAGLNEQKRQEARTALNLAVAQKPDYLVFCDYGFGVSLKVNATVGAEVERLMGWPL
jgi:hypothetical protein